MALPTFVNSVIYGRKSIPNNDLNSLLTDRSLGKNKRGFFFRNLLSEAASLPRSREVQRMRLYARLHSRKRKKRRRRWRYYKSSSLCSLRQDRGITGRGKNRWNAYQQPATAAWKVQRFPPQGRQPMPISMGQHPADGMEEENLPC